RVTSSVWPLVYPVSAGEPCWPIGTSALAGDGHRSMPGNRLTRYRAPKGKRMANDDRTRFIPRRTPESAAMSANVKRAMAITAALNRLTYNDADEIRALFSDLIGKKVDDSFLLIPPFYAAGGLDISVGR